MVIILSNFKEIIKINLSRQNFLIIYWSEQIFNFYNNALKELILKVKKNNICINTLSLFILKT